MNNAERMNSTEDMNHAEIMNNVESMDHASLSNCDFVFGRFLVMLTLMQIYFLVVLLTIIPPLPSTLRPPAGTHRALIHGRPTNSRLLILL